MSNLENTITDVMLEGAMAPKAKASAEKPDPDAEKKASAAADKAGDATSKAKAPGGDKASEKGGEVKDGETKVEKGKAVNQEEIESEDEAISEMGKMEGSKSNMLKAMVSKMKEMGMKELKATWSKMEMDDMEDKDGEEDDAKVESLSRNALIRSVVESLKDRSIEEVASFLEGFDELEEMSKMSDKDKDEKKAKSMKSEKDEDEDEDDSDEEEEEDEAVKKESYDIDMTDDIEALVSDEDLSEEFKIKAKTIFEASVASKVKEQLAEREAELEEEMNLKVEEVKDDLTEQVDSYLNYVSESWVKENELAIERGLKSELTEDFINGLKKLFEEHYVEVPEDKFDVVEELANRLDEMEDKLNEEVANNISAQQDIEELQREKIISEASNDLADTQVEKLKTLSEDVDFESVEKFVEKVSTLKESYFGTEKLEAVSDDSTVASSDADFSGAGDVAQPVNEGMAQYTAALSKFASLEK